MPAKKTAAPAVKAGTSVQSLLAGYKGAVPLKGLLSWSLLIVLGALAVGLLLAQILIAQRQAALIQTTATRVDLQAQARAGVVREWLAGLEKVADTLAGADVMRLYTTEVGGAEVGGAAGGELSAFGEALLAQKPYVQQVLVDAVARHQLEGAHLIASGGVVLASSGQVPGALVENPAVLQAVLAGQPQVLALRPAQSLTNAGQVMLDIVRPIRKVGETEGPAVGALWLTFPAGVKLADLVASGPLDRPGERTAVLQSPAENAPASVVGAGVLSPLNDTLADLQNTFENGRALSLSVVDGLAVFATLLPIPASPLAVLQEFKAADALAELNLIKPGIYSLVALAVGVLAVAMLALTAHLLAQRNRTRVKLLGQSMDALVRVVEARDSHLAGHHIRVARLAVAVASQLGLGVAERATLYYAGLLSAVGRVLVPGDILTKKAALTATERKALQAHISQAVGILSELELDLPVAPVIAQMYERANGQGFPHGLKGGQISQMARVLGACDAYVALTSKRAHRDALSRTAALKELDSPAFDANVHAALVQITK